MIQLACENSCLWLIYKYMLIGAYSGRNVSHMGVYGGIEIGKV